MRALRAALLGLLAPLGLATAAGADVVRDGTVGPSTDVQPEGPNFVVTQSMGELVARNLFHSFSDFSLDPSQSVLFTGTSPIANIVARITGGEISTIQGLVGSDVPGANLFLLNPQGFVFTEGATVDVDGGLYVSSANVLEFSDGSSFNTGDTSGAPVLSAASPVAFGFLSGDPGSIVVAGSELEAREGRTLALVGGELTLEGASLEAEGGEVRLIAAGPESLVSVDGPVELASASSASMTDSEVDVSGDPHGTIRIASSSLSLADASLSSTNEGDGAGAATGLEIRVEGELSITGESELAVSTEGAGDAGAIVIQGGSVVLDDDAQLLSETTGDGRAGPVSLTVDQLTLDGDAEIASDVEGEANGRGGSVTVDARVIQIQGDAEISADTDEESTGSGGSVSLTASETLRIEMETEPGEEGGVFTNSEGSGDAGSIRISTPVLLVDGGVVFAGTEGDGLGGSIDIHSDDVLVRGRGAVSAASEGDGNAGSIRVKGTGTLRLEAGGRVTTESELSDGGNISVGDGYTVVDLVDGVMSANVGDGVGGNIDVASEHIVLDHSAVVAQAGAGQGGAITLTSASFFSSESVLSASAGPAGISGTVTVNAPDVNLTGSLTPLPTNYLDAARLIRSACQEGGSHTGQLSVEVPRGEPSTVEGLPARVEYDRSGLDSALADLLESSYRVRRHPGGQPVEESLRQLEEAATRVDAIEEPAQQAYALVHLANTYATLALTQSEGHRPAVLSAYSALVRARALGATSGDRRVASFVEGNLAQLYASQGRVADGLRLVEVAIREARRAAAPSALYRWHWLEGDLLWATGQSQGAIEAYRRSVDLLEVVRHESLALENVPALGKFNADVAPVYLALVSALLQGSDLVSDPASRQVLLAEARATLEQFKSAELRNYLQDPCVTELEEKTASLDNLTPTAAVVYPILLPDRLELLVSTQAGMTRHTVPVSGRQVATETRRFRHAIQDVGSTRHLRHARKLHDWIVAPWADQLASAGIDTVVFVPDRALRAVPMSALHDGDAYLIERFAIVTAPGLDLVDPRRLERDAIRPVLAGITEGIEDYDPLPRVEDELVTVAGLYESEMLIDQDFVLGNLQASFDARRPSVLHLASHAEFASSATDSFVLTYDGRVPLDELVAVISRSRFSDEPLELLVLSACETAAGSDQAALGLAGLAVQAGARSVVGTLWSISDEAAAEVFADFYERLGQESLTKAQALRQAQLDLKAQPRFSHPFFWSPFLIINNWL